MRFSDGPVIEPCRRTDRCPVVLVRQLDPVASDPEQPDACRAQALQSCREIGHLRAKSVRALARGGQAVGDALDDGEDDGHTEIPSSGGGAALARAAVRHGPVEHAAPTIGEPSA